MRNEFSIRPFLRRPRPEITYLANESSFHRQRNFLLDYIGGQICFISFRRFSPLLLLLFSFVSTGTRLRGFMESGAQKEREFL